jgi:hypothetical protein
MVLPIRRRRKTKSFSFGWYMRARERTAIDRSRATRLSLEIAGEGMILDGAARILS